MAVTLKERAEQAYSILNQKTRYAANKAIISSLFIYRSERGNEEEIIKRLTIIDSYYSTQMNKRLFGLEQMAKSLTEKSDEELLQEIDNFLLDPLKQNFLNVLFKSQYGIDKTGKKAGRAISLLSKYFFFLTNYAFPIYDAVVKKAYPLIISQSNKVKKLSENNYFDTIIELNENTGIENFEKLDNLLWLIGKLKYGSASILMNYESYRTLARKINQEEFQKKMNQKKVSKDDIIRSYIINNLNTIDLTDLEREFYQFTIELQSK